MAKVHGHHITANYRESYDPFVATRTLFNHESERRGLRFVTRKVTWHVAAIKLAVRERVAPANLGRPARLGYAKEYVVAMSLMLQQDRPDDYVIATGETSTVRRLVEIAFDEVGPPWEPGVVLDDVLRRPAEVDLLFGDADKAEREPGCVPRTSFDALIRLMVRADLELLAP